MSSGTADRISNLPGNVIDQILNYLPLRDAVRTSILSTEWRYKWVTIPHLVFDWHFKRSLRRKWSPEVIIDHMLLSHKGTIVKFEYSLSNIGIFGHLSIDRWLHILSNHRIESLTLCLDATSTLPYLLFSFDHLKHLKLSHVYIKPPPSFKRFCGLVKLELFNVHNAPEEWQWFLSRCPMLEFLCICKRDDPTTFVCLDFDAPNLKHLSLEHVDTEPLTFKGYSKLVKLNLVNVRIAPEGLQRFISQCPMLESLCVCKCNNPLTFWDLDVVALNLKHLYLEDVDIKPPPTFQGFSGLLKLELGNVYIAPKELQSFISKCPMLEFLSIRECCEPTAFWSLNIDAPNLRVLNLVGKFSSICLKTESVEEISVHYGGQLPEPNGCGNNLIDFFGDLTSLRKLVLDAMCLQMLAVGGLLQELPNKLNHLAILELNPINFRLLDILTCVLCLIRSSLNLQSLHIVFCGCSCNSIPMNAQEKGEAMEYLKAEQKCKIPLSNLSTAIIIGFSGFETEVEFVKVLLLRGTVLRRLEVISDGCTEEAVHELTRFHLASSSSTEVVFRCIGSSCIRLLRKNT